MTRTQGKPQSRTQDQTQKEYQEHVVQIKRVSKKNQGGSSMSFAALVVIGNKKGKIGTGIGKAGDVPSAVQKAISNAKKSIVEIKLKGGTIPHRISNKYGSAKVLMMPAPEGSGIIAGGSVRNVVELCGIKNISAKILGSANKTCNVRCAIEALAKLRA